MLKLKGLRVSNVEGKVLQFLLTKNKTLDTLDLSNIKADSSEYLECFLSKFNQQSNIRYLVIDNVYPELTTTIETFGKAVNEN